MSVVPAPMSTSTTPSSFSSLVSTAVLDASEPSTRSSTCRWQRLMHLVMFCAADCAPTTRCARTSSRAAERGIGVLAILHDLNLAAMYADRLAVQDGEHAEDRKSTRLNSSQ